MTRSLLCAAVLSGLALVAQLALAGGNAGGRAGREPFGAIYIDGKKAGQIQYDENGDVETLKTRASLSILGIKLFNFEQNLHEAWQGGAIRTLKGHTDDDDEIYRASVQRGQDVYPGTLNDKPVELPGNAFPASVWHYRITDHPLLFDLKNLRLMRVQVARPEETIKIDKVATPTERFDLTDDWQASPVVHHNKFLVSVRLRGRGPQGQRRGQ